MARTKQTVHLTTDGKGVNNNGEPIPAKTAGRKKGQGRTAVKTPRNPAPGLEALRDIFSKTPFRRLVRELANEVDFINTLEFRWQASALDCLQQAAEVYLTIEFAKYNLAAIHARRVTIMGQGRKAR